MEQVLSFAYNDEDIDVVYNLYQNVEYGFSAFNPGISQLWQMVKIITRSSTIPQATKTSLFDTLYASDDTDTKIKFKLQIEAMVSTGEARIAIYNNCASETLELSADHVSYTLQGLNDSWVPEAERRAVAEKYMAQIYEVVNKRSMTIAKSFTGNFRPKTDDLTAFVG
jgi:hypothetical protein